jgi:UDP-glucuronate 4-epimerase
LPKISYNQRKNRGCGLKILITGAAGFIGFNLAKALLERGDEIVGLDVINDYYDVNLKYARLERLGIDKEAIEQGKRCQSRTYTNHLFYQIDLKDKEALFELFKTEKFDAVCNLAAQAGVRYSLTNPDAYIDSNIIGFINILEACRHHGVNNLSYASSSSVYGLNESQPFSTHHNVDHPISLYAASKKSNELMAHTYSKLFGISTTGLRFFTVYGPWGRPDMALFLFTKAILEGKPIDVFNYGKMQRDFTYIDDIVDGVIRVIDNPAKPNLEWNGAHPDPSTSPAPYKIYNIGNNSPVSLMEFIECIEDELGKKAEKNLLPIQPGDVPSTYADVSDLANELGYAPKTGVREGIANFVAWYREFYGA